MWVHRLTNLDVEKKTAVCAHCGPVDVFFLNKGGGRSCWHCGEARRARARARSKTPEHKAYMAQYRKGWEAENKDRRSIYNRRQLLRHHGLTEADYERMYQDRGGRCDLCHEIFEQLCVDHDHHTLKIRGLLCGGCNLALGHLKDRPEVAARIPTYLALNLSPQGVP